MSSKERKKKNKGLTKPKTEPKKREKKKIYIKKEKGKRNMVERQTKNP